MIIVPVHNGGRRIEMIYRQLANSLSTAGTTYRVLFVDDGSTDDSWDCICCLAHGVVADKLPIKGIRLDRNRGQQAALIAALTLTEDNSVITMDDDGSHPVDAIPALARVIDDGAQLVYAQPNQRPGNPIRRWFSSLHQYHMCRMTGADSSVKVGSFRAMSPSLVERVLSAATGFPYLSAQCLSLRPAPQTVMMKTREWTSKGKSRFSIWKLFILEWKLAVNYGAPARFRRRLRRWVRRRLTKHRVESGANPGCGDRAIRWQTARSQAARWISEQTWQ